MSLRGQNRERAVNEVVVLKDKKNPNIVNSLDSFLVDGDLWLVMEYMDGGTLQDIVRQTCMAEGEMAAVSWVCTDETYRPRFSSGEERTKWGHVEDNVKTLRNVGVRKGFRGSFNLINHHKIHTGERPYKWSPYPHSSRPSPLPSGRCKSI
ncbi:serine/threonine-protein kinase CST20-like [Parus major]|uniref:serine/threonine-protein kinase CST20-like n=1 Tax=Parus major TaxID=9157 RepID=UPI0008F4A1E5|nr:serine/threonine-protein kinase CST20-like [Parus major]